MCDCISTKTTFVTNCDTFVRKTGFSVSNMSRILSEHHRKHKRVYFFVGKHLVAKFFQGCCDEICEENRVLSQMCRNLRQKRLHCKALSFLIVTIG